MSKINKILSSNFRGIKSSYCSKDLLPFNVKNIIYGYNGSGKTTLSTMLAILDKASSIPEDKANFVLEYLDDNLQIAQLGIESPFKEMEKQRSYLNIKVFNRDFIDSQVFTSTHKLKHIVRLGDIGKKAEGLDELEKQQLEFQTKEREINSKLTALQDSLSKWFTAQAKNFYSICTGYKIVVESHFSKTQLEKLLSSKIDYVQLTESDLKLAAENCKKESLGEIIYENISLPNIKQIASEVKNILTEKISIIESITRLVSNDDLNNWVGEGKRNYLKDEFCPFCEQRLSSDFLIKLDKHFNEDAEKLIAIINSKKDELNKVLVNIENLKIIGKECFYKTNYEEYDKVSHIFLSEKKSIIDYIKLLIQFLETKSKNIFKNEFNVPECESFSFLNSYKEMIKINNTETKNLSDVFKKAGESIKGHFLFPLKEYFEEQNNIIIKHQGILAEVSKQRKESCEKIKNLRDTIKSYVKPCNEINNYLQEYWGHTNFKLVPDELGYSIQRTQEVGKFARNLSEGEKTAVAFSYFLKTLEDDDFDIKNGIVIIDDPISSLDSNSIFTAFGLIRRKLSSANQLFVLTHNYVLFNEFKQWFDREEKTSNYYFTEKHGNELHLINMPSALRRGNSDYPYLFSRLYKFANQENDMMTEEKYIEANTLRRVLESYLYFKLPKSGDFFSRLFELKAKTIDEVKKTRIMKYANLFSHDDGSIGLYGQIDMGQIIQDCQTIIKDALKFIEETDSSHYKSLEQNILSSEKEKVKKNSDPIEEWKKLADNQKTENVS